jgi:bifunctional enzyme CysN/CysC
MLVHPDDKPVVTQEFEATLCWMVDQPLQVKGRYAIKHTTRWARAVVTSIDSRMDVNSGETLPGATELGLNDIGRVHLKTTVPLFIDRYADSRATGSFILVDEATNNTVAAGMILLPTP